jgi:hypothetical protein
MKTERILAVLLAFISITGVARPEKAQTPPSIALGLSTISLGAAASDVIKSLSVEYLVEPSATDGASSKQRWGIIKRSEKYKVPFADLFVRNNKVVGFSYEVEMFDFPTSQNGFDYFVSLVEKLTNEKRSQCTLTSGTSFLNGAMPVRKTSVDFACGPYNFYLLRNEYRDDSNAPVAGYLLVENIGETD